ncbi:MAG: hypothetical protein WC655_11035 [Candidatus Hydrogenedentales bacterium]|jgi:hypothetical protein
MYTSPNSLILGFHGCDRAVGEKVLSGKAQHLSHSENEYDWLGHGVYFWENNPDRALQFARELREKPRKGKAPTREPFVLGAVIDPGKCLNLLESKSLRIVQESYEFLCATVAVAGTRMPENKRDEETGELLRRNLDCAVIETLHGQGKSRYDTVRGVFFEGPPLYAGSGFREKNHIQICVRTPSCIKGYFRLLPVA